MGRHGVNALRAALACCVFGWALLLAGCTRSELHIAYPTWIGFETLTLADEFGWLPDNVVLHRLDSAEAVTAAMQDGRVQGVAVSLHQALQLREQIGDVIVVLVMDESAGADVVLARPSIQDLKALAGSRLAIYPDSAVSVQLLHGALTRAGLPFTAPQRVELPFPQHEAAYRDGLVDVVVTFPPSSDRIRDLGAKVLFDSSEMPGMIVDVLALRGDTAIASAETVEGLIEGYFRALEHLSRNRDDAVYRIAAYQNTDVANVRQALRGIRLPGINGVREYLADGGAVQASAQSLVDIGLVGADVDMTGFVQGRFLPGDGF